MIVVQPVSIQQLKGIPSLELSNERLMKIIRMGMLLLKEHTAILSLRAINSVPRRPAKRQPRNNYELKIASLPGAQRHFLIL